MTLKRRLEDLETRPQMQPPDEDFLRHKLVAEAFAKEDSVLFHRALDALETAERLTIAAALENATPEQLPAVKRLQELERLPLEELRGLVA